jgi:redox-sensing transcriptional repressor
MRQQAVRERNIPDATVARLPLYLRALVELQERSIGTVSSGDLARASGVNPAKLRKDLSHLGSFGTRGVGYPVKELVDGISGALGLTDERPVVIVGLGNLGQALAHYGGFAQRGFRIAALLDADPALVGTRVASLEVEDVAELETIVRERGVTIAVLATPANAANDVAQRLVDAGVTAIMNFAPTHIAAPDEVTVRKVDLSVELQILSFYEQLHADGGLAR